MTKLQFNSTVPNDIYYNNQSVNKVFYVDPNGVQTEVWPLTPTTLIGTDLTTVLASEMITTASDSDEAELVVYINFSPSGFIDIIAQSSGDANEVNLVGLSLSTIPPHNSTFPTSQVGQSEAEVNPKNLFQKFKWISTATSGVIIANPNDPSTRYQVKNVPATGYQQPADEGSALGSNPNEWIDIGGFNISEYAQIAFRVTGGRTERQGRNTFTIKEPNGNETSFNIDHDLIQAGGTPGGQNTGGDLGNVVEQ